MPWWESEVKARSPVQVDVDRLSFDTKNPRFTPETTPDSPTDRNIIAELANSADLEELIESISTSGYVNIEPLVVIGRDEKLVVLEGNRRLAALKVLRDQTLVSAANVSAKRELSKEVKGTLDKVSVYRVEDPAEARDFIGFKHINGPHKWNAYAKARYAAKWLDEEKQKRERREAGLTLSDIARRMGDGHATIYRIVSGIYVLEQAENRRMFQVDDRAKRTFSFSHLYTALTYAEYRDFLGLEPADRTQDPPHNPVPEDKLENLRRVFLWLYGSKPEGIKPVINSQSPDLGRLKRVLGNARARRVMLETGDLTLAEESTISAADRLESSLVTAERQIGVAQSSVEGYDGKDEALLQIAESVSKKSAIVHKNMSERSNDGSA